MQCREEAHRPVVCETVAKWILKNSAESENMNWYAINNVLKYCLVCVSYTTHISTNGVCYKLSCVFTNYMLLYLCYAIHFPSYMLLPCYNFSFWWSLMYLMSWYLFHTPPAVFSSMYRVLLFFPSLSCSPSWIEFEIW